MNIIIVTKQFLHNQKYIQINMIKQSQKPNMKASNGNSIKAGQLKNEFMNRQSPEGEGKQKKLERGRWDQQSSEQKDDQIDPKSKLDFINAFNKLDNQRLKRNTFIFGILLILLHIGICIVYGLKVITPGTSKVHREIIYFNAPNQEQSKLGIKSNFSSDLTPLFINIFTIFITVVGFALLFTYNKKLLWSAIGFNLFICCLTVQIYFIFNNLINKIGINPDLQKSSDYWRIYLWNYQYDTIIQNKLPIYASDYLKIYGNTLVDAFKCGLANCLAFSAIRGKAGLLEALYVAILGTIGYEFNRQILASMGIDFGQSNSIFTFGGFFGVTMALIKSIRSKYKDEKPSKANRFNQANLNSVFFSLIGLGILVSFFPILAAHPTPKQYLYFSQSFFIAPYSVYHSMAAGAMMSLACSFLIHGKASIRQFINGTIGAGIAVLCSSYFINNPGFPMVIGLFSATVQALVQIFVQRKLIQKFDIISTYSFSLFGIQGLIGAAAGSIFKAVLLSTNQLNYSRSQIRNTSEPIILGLISVGIGIATGLFAGFIIRFFDFNREVDKFHDKTYWQDQQAIFQQEQDQFENWQDLWQKLIPQLMPES